jgi:phosphate transport system substrate-binding protein
VICIVYTKKKKEIKTLVALGIIGISLISITLFSGCTQNQEGLSIVVIGRDSASGTREFFWEHVMGKENFTSKLQEKNSNGGIYQTVTQTPGAIGYVGLGYVDSGVKALKINNITATAENVLAGTYPIARDLYLFTMGNASGLAKEFIDYIMSTEGQEIVADEGFVPLPTSEPYNSSNKNPSGSLTIGGSTTVFPIVEKVKDAFKVMYPQISITVSSTGSGAGITAVIAGTVDIAMSSRDLKSSESDKSLMKYTIARDGIAIIVNTENTYVDNITMTQLKAIYKGEITNWKDLTLT